MKTFLIHVALGKDLLASRARVKDPKGNISLILNDINDG
jgi:hypothetical protein